MHTLTLNIRDDAYQNVLYILKNLMEDVEIVSDKVIDVQAEKGQKISSLRGAIHQYADPSKVGLEESAWADHVAETYNKGDI